MNKPIKVAVVTPYHNEPENYIRKCIESVRSQTYFCTHIMISDGSDTCFIKDSEPLMHIKLPYGSRDWGNTPRGIGAMLADAYGFDAVTFLDADNWYEDEHIEKMIAASETSQCPIVTCKRKLYTIDEKLMGSIENLRNGIFPMEIMEQENLHVDTNCYLILRSAFSIMKNWFSLKEFAALGDRIFLARIIQAKIDIHYSNNMTSCYRDNNALHYMHLGLPVPSSAKYESLYDTIRILCATKEGLAEQARKLDLEVSLFKKYIADAIL